MCVCVSNTALYGILPEPYKAQGQLNEAEWRIYVSVI